MPFARANHCYGIFCRANHCHFVYRRCMNQATLRFLVFSVALTALVPGMPLHSQDSAQNSSNSDSANAEQRELYKATTGPFSVKVHDQWTLDDESREAALQLRVTYPVQADNKSDANTLNVDRPDETQNQPFPVIIFSHGAGGSKTAYEPLVHHWVSHGYVCVQATHGDSLTLMTRAEKRSYRSMRSYVNSGALAKHQLTRPDEIKLILDQLKSIETEVPTLKRKLDCDTVGMGGHSFGAHTTQLIGGLSLRDFRGRGRIVKQDERPKALLMISPQGTGGQIDKQSWEKIQRPTMVVTGSQDLGRKGQSHEWRMEAYEYLPAEQKFLTFIQDATHGFGGISGSRFAGSGAPNEDHLTYVRSSTTAFWDAYLRDEETALNYLQSDRLSEATDGQATIRHK